MNDPTPDHNGSLNHVVGDLLTFPCDAIVHQTNCATRDIHGLADSIAQTYDPPTQFTNLLPETYTPSLFGHAFGVDAMHLEAGLVINLYAQHFPGRAKGRPDTYHDRLEAFQKGLNGFDWDAWGVQHVAFPKYIGCALAGGDWALGYLPVLERFAKEHPEMKVSVVALAPRR